MKTMLKALVSLVVVAACVFSVPVVAFAQGGRVFDDAGLLDAAQIADLESDIAVLEESIGGNLVVATTADAGGKTEVEYADDYYINGGFAADGALFLIDMDNRQICISTSGEMIRYLDDARIEAILDVCYAAVAQEDYYGAASAFIAEVEGYYGTGIEEDQYNYDTETGEISYYNSVSAGELLFAGAVSIVVAVLVCLAVMAKYQLKFSQYRYPLQERSRFTLTRKEDIFLNEHTTSRRIESSSSNGGGGGGGGSASSTHTSSSGSTHGGGSRSF